MSSQNRWFSIIDEFDGDREAAKKHLAKMLRKAADLVEDPKDTDLDVFGCTCPGKSEDILGGHFIGEVKRSFVFALARMKLSHQC